MRVLEIVRGLRRGGAERALLNRLGDAPEGVTTAVLNLDPSLDVLDLPSGVLVMTCLHGPNRVRSCVGRAVTEFRPDVIVVRTPRDLVLLTLSCRSAVGRVPVVFEAHSETVSTSRAWRQIAGPLLRWANRRATLHVAVSDRVAQGPQCRDARRVATVRLGARVNPDAPAALPSIRGTRFILLGRLIAAKRPAWVVERVAELATEFRATGSELVIVGGGPLMSEVVRTVEDRGLSDVVKICGDVEDPDGFLKSSDVLLVASTSEGLPLVIFEAKMMGLRVVSTPAGGSGEVLDGEDSPLRGFGDSEFRAALVRELEHGPLDVAERSRSVARTSHWDSRHATVEFYRELAALPQCRTIVEFLSGPIEGGITSGLRTRLRSDIAGVATVIICPFVATEERKAAADSFGCPVVACAPGVTGVRQMWAGVRNAKPDVMIAHTERDLMWLTITRIAVRPGSRVVYVVHADRSATRRSRALASAALTRILRPTVWRTLAVSQKAAQGQLGARMRNVIVVDQAPEFTEVVDLSPLPEAPQMLAVARLVPGKGVDRLIEGAAIAQAPLRAAGASLRVVGDGPETARLRSLIDMRGVGDIVSLLGYQAGAAQLGSTAHYFLQPSLSEGMGRALVEAMAGGARGVSGPVGAAVEVLTGDDGSTLFAAVPTAAEWGVWFACAATSPLPSLDERRARARWIRDAYDARACAEDFYRVAAERMADPQGHEGRRRVGAPADLVRE